MNVVFDWAGTLADDQELTWRLTDAVIREAGHPGVDFQTYQREFTLPAGPFYKKFASGAAFADIETAFAALCRREYPASVQLWPGVREGLDCLRCKHDLYLLSSLDQSMLEAALARLDLRSRFRKVVGSAVDKTVALPALLRAEGLAQDETVMIGDTPHDMAAARAAGVAGAAVTYGYGKAAAFAGEETVCASFAEVMRTLDKTAAVAGRYFPVATVGGLIRDDGGNLLLVRTRKWGGRYGIPGGKIDYGETMEAAFVREAREETGLEVADVAFVMNQDCVEHPEFYRPRHFILVNYTARTAGTRPPVRLNHESDDYVWAAPEAAMRMSLNGPTRVLLEKVLGPAARKQGEA